MPCIHILEPIQTTPLVSYIIHIDHQELGNIYEVKKVGFVLVDKSDCEIKKINTLNALGGKCKCICKR
jgi:hypothetical protein